jgi:chromosome segregation ATPase
LFRLYGAQLPSARKDGRISELLTRVKEGLAEYQKSSQRLVKAEHGQFDEFQRMTVNSQVSRIRAKQVDMIDFSQFESLVKQYNLGRLSLEEKSKASAAAIAALGKAIGSDEAGWLQVDASLAREWNQSLLGMQQIYARVEELKRTLAEQEQAAKSAHHDSNNLQQVISKMRDEIVAVDSKAEEFRRESSRFASAAGGAVDPALMLQRASEAEKNAKEEIAKREALRQSQDSLEAQLEAMRNSLVKAELAASETRKSIAETVANVEMGERAHAELEGRFKAEFTKAVSGWTDKLNGTAKSLTAVADIVAQFNDINALIAEENEQKDLLGTVIGDLVSKLQRLQMSLQA